MLTSQPNFELLDFLAGHHGFFNNIHRKVKPASSCKSPALGIQGCWIRPPQSLYQLEASLERRVEGKQEKKEKKKKKRREASRLTKCYSNNSYRNLTLATPSNSLPPQIRFLGYAGQVSAIPASAEQVILCGEWITWWFFRLQLVSTCIAQKPDLR